MFKAIATVVLLGLAAAPGLAGDTIEKEVDAKPGGMLELDLDSCGSAVVEGWDRDKVRVVVSEEHGRLDRFEVEVKESKGGVRVVADFKDPKLHSSSMHFEVMVPRMYNIDFRSCGGSFSLAGVEGEFTGRTGGGSLRFEDAKGVADMRTGGGSIHVTDCELDGELATGGGEVMVENVVGNLKATTGGGGVRYVNVRAESESGKRASSGNKDDSEAVRIQTGGGSINLKEAPSGAVLHTGGGSINVDGARLFVEALTGGGDIRIRCEDGWVQATTGAGDVAVTIATSGKSRDQDMSVQIASGTGDVTLTVPKDFSMELAIDLAYTKRGKQNYKITSDFAIEVEESDDWDFDQGSPRKHILGTANLHGGKHKVVIETVNGNVRILEGS